MKLKVNRREFLKNTVVTTAALTGGSVAAGILCMNSSASDAPLRPPGAVDESEFLARCIRCKRCVEACPNIAIITLDDSLGRHRRGTPIIKPRRQACMLCNGIEGDYLKCTQACPTGALQLIPRNIESVRRNVSMGTAHIDKALCNSYNGWTCGVCYRACPLRDKAMTIGLWEKPTVNPDACIGCGCCERACIRMPHAIRVKPEGAS